jgi:hypothetical protein
VSVCVGYCWCDEAVSGEQCMCYATGLDFIHNSSRDLLGRNLCLLCCPPVPNWYNLIRNVAYNILYYLLYLTLHNDTCTLPHAIHHLYIMYM